MLPMYRWLGGPRTPPSSPGSAESSETGPGKWSSTPTSTPGCSRTSTSSSGRDPIGRIWRAGAIRVIYFLAMREYLSGIRALLDTTGGRLVADVRPVAYERLLGRMTKDFWWRRAKESYWILARHGWSPRRREVPRALGSLAARLGRYASARGGLPIGTHIFAGLDRLSPEETRRAAFVWRILAESHP